MQLSVVSKCYESAVIRWFGYTALLCFCSRSPFASFIWVSYRGLSGFQKILSRKKVGTQQGTNTG
jgi:hypothetical protein